MSKKELKYNPKDKEFNPFLDVQLCKHIARLKKIKNGLINEAISRLSKEKKETLAKATQHLTTYKNQLVESRKPIKDRFKTVVNQDGNVLSFNSSNAEKIEATPYIKTNDKMSFIMPVKTHDGFYISGKLIGISEHKKLEKFTLHKN